MSREHPRVMTAPGDQDAMFKRMFASFVARKIRGSSAPTPHPHPPPEPLRRTTSDHRSSRSQPRGIAALLSPSGAGSPGYRSYHSSSSHRNNSSAPAAAAAALAAANGLSGSTPYGHQQYRQSNAQYNTSQAYHYQEDQEPPSYGRSSSRQSRGSGRGTGPFSPLLRGLTGAGPSRRQSGKLSEKTASTDEDHPPRKRSRPNIVRSQSAHAGSLHQSSSRKQDKSKSRLDRRRRAATPVEPMESVAPRPANAPRARGGAQARSFPCNMCESVFAQRGQLSRHVRRVHEKLRPHACEHCGKLFGARSDRTRHIQIIHHKKRDVKCPHCKYMFGTNDHLQAHIRTVHHGERPAVCNECGMSFGLRSNMLAHQRTVHNREQKWPCHLCPKAFNRKHDKDRHMRLVHESK